MIPNRHSLMRLRFTLNPRACLSPRASPASLTLTTGATFCPNWLMTTTSMISRKLCCRRRRITRESGDGRGGLTRRRSGTRREMVRGYGWGLMRLLKMRLWLMTELLSR
ncbi:hypothetical protein LINPERHAP1_LOCUS23622 [Linum perenne]